MCTVNLKFAIISCLSYMMVSSYLSTSCTFHSLDNHSSSTWIMLKIHLCGLRSGISIKIETNFSNLSKNSNDERSTNLALFSMTNNNNKSWLSQNDGFCQGKSQEFLRVKKNLIIHNFTFNHINIAGIFTIVTKFHSV